MPVYEYRCPKCGHEFEVMRPVSKADEPAPCPKCSTPGGKLVSSFASKAGFYIRAPRKPPFRKREAETKE